MESVKLARLRNTKIRTKKANKRLKKQNKRVKKSNLLLDAEEKKLNPHAE